MSRAATASRLGAIAAIALALTACSGGGHGSPVATTPACPLLTELAATGRTVARADVSDPDEFDSTLKTAVADYVHIARRLQATVPLRLRDDVARLEAAAEQYRFTDATSARAALDDYARSTCTTAESKKSG